MAAGTTFGTYNPQATDPYQIETKLVGDLSDPNASGYALPWLNAYRGERAVQSGNYANELASQHDYANQALAADIANNEQKSFMDVLKEPGALGVAASSPLFGRILSGLNIPAANDFLGRQQRGQEAGILEKTGSGVNALVSSGNLLQPGDVSARLGGSNVTQTDPLSLRVADRNNAAHIAAAHIRAAGSAGDKHPLTEIVTLPDGRQIHVASKGSTGRESMTNLNANRQDVLDETAPKTPSGVPLATGSDAVDNHRTVYPLVNQLAKGTPAAQRDYKNIMDGMKGGKIQTTKDGRPIGKDGHIYDVRG